jgi:hypothetical protein
VRDHAVNGVAVAGRSTVSLRRFPTWWRGHAETALHYLALRPAALFSVLWAANAVRFPYGNLIHDARLYALQVQNQVSGGFFSADLFLRYGSQDRFTPFSRIVAPAVAALGVDWTFVLLFVVFNGLLIFALQRLSFALVDDPRVAVAGVLMTVVSPMPYGGLGIFHVLEFFFTPRIMSCALAIYALERIVRQHYTWGLLLGVAATIIHPLMGFGAAAIGLCCAAHDRLPERAVVPAMVATAVTGGILLAYRRLATAVFGTMDAEWLEVTRQASAYNFPALWTARDWLQAALSIAVAVWAAVELRTVSRSRARFVFLSAMVGVVGVGTMIVAAAVPYRLLLQGQPYRILWVLAVVQIPLVCWLAARLWSRGPKERVVAVLLIASLQLSNASVEDALLSLMSVAFCLIALNRPNAKVSFNETLVPGVVAGLAVGCVISMCIRLRVIGVHLSTLVSLFGLKTLAEILLNVPGPLVWVAIVLSMTAIMIRRGPRPLLPVGAVLMAIAVHTTAFALPRLPAFRDTEIAYGRDLGFIENYFARRDRAARAPAAVYDGIWESSNLVWFDLRATSYFNLVQLSGVLFNRETAIEGRRRATVVRPFELERFNAIGKFMPWGDKLMITSLFGPAEGVALPTRADVIHLCGRDEPIDVAIVKHNFEGLGAVSNGRISLYDCAQLRAAIGE